jgi:hypothetical protein
MRSDKPQALSGMNTRQKVIAGVLVLVLIIVGWQIIGLFGGGGSTPATTPAPVISNQAATPPRPTPKAAELVKVQPPTSQREIELMKLQEETQAKYLAALNELQMLKVTRDIAEANQAITAAQLATVTAQKNIVNILAPQQPVMQADYARGLVNPVTSGNVITTPAPTTTVTQTTTTQQEATYTVISVSQLQYRWHAVLGYQGNLYNVSIGDVLPADGAVVKAIDKSGVILERNGVKKKISLVPII